MGGGDSHGVVGYDVAPYDPDMGVGGPGEWVSGGWD